MGASDSRSGSLFWVVPFSMIDPFVFTMEMARTRREIATPRQQPGQNFGFICFAARDDGGEGS